ncbi:MAG: ATP-dependent helicase [Vampirovibrionia bacterium]
MKNITTKENSILQSLNDSQKQAVTDTYGPILIAAGAGSGKTRVLTQRIAYLIDQGISPYEVLAVTFTNKAASEMKHRISSCIGEETAKKLWIGTFHSICGKLLRLNIEKLGDGRKQNFVIFDNKDSISITKQAIKELDLDEKRYNPKIVHSKISSAKNSMISAYDFTSNADDFFNDTVGRVYHKYEELLINNNSLDFDDMLLLTVKLLNQDKDVREYYQKRFKHILVDEFQDTNKAQYELIKLLASYGENTWEDSSLCVVGDVDQSIYSWRGADYKIILGFQEDFQQAKIYKLEENYRSVQSILDIANSIIVNNVERLEKNLYCTKGKGQKAELYQAYDESAEALYVTKEISKLLKKGYQNSDIAILYRTNSQSRVIEEALMTKKMPYHIVGGMRFYDRKEIKDILAYLKILYNPSDSQSIKRVINEPKRSIGKTTLDKIDTILSQNQSLNYIEVLKGIETYEGFNKRSTKPISEFTRIIEYLRSCADSLSLRDLIEKVAMDTGYIQMLRDEATPEADSRLENISELLNVANEFETREQTSDLGEFLTQLSLLSDLDNLPENTTFITLMTLHSAKGLEYPIVFLTGLEEGIFPHFRSLENDSEMEEERRLMYVGVTRAQEILHITHTQKRRMHGDYRYLTKSRFLDEIPEEYLNVNKKSVSTETYKTYNSSKFNNSSNSNDNYTTSFGKDFNISNNKQTTRSSSSNSNNLGFGRDFVAPVIKRNKKENSSNNKEITEKKNTSSKTIKEIKTSNSNNNNQNTINKNENAQKIKRKTSKSDLSECIKITCKEQISDTKKPEEAPTYEVFEKGDKVYHQRFGSGYIETTIKISENIIYSVIFEQGGKKALDAQSARLKRIDVPSK